MLRRAELDPATQRNIDSWLNGKYDEATKAEIKQLLAQDPQKAIDAFYTTLAFGTGGMRGLMGVGTNRINIYTVRYAVQGLANYIHQQPNPLEGHSVFIGYDSRRNSRLFAEEAAKVLAGNGIRAYLCAEMRPTPYVSFGCLYKQCTAGIMITASHNPPEYNGFKVYWSDGAQVMPPHDAAIMAEAASIQDPSKVKSVDSIEHLLIDTLGDDVEKAYLEQSCSLQLYPEQNKHHGHKLNITYTSLHGTGITLVPRLFKTWGFTNVNYVEEQIGSDPNFTTANPPNPENPSALALGIAAMEQQESDILIATDPDADRVGVVVRHEGKPEILTGNQIACICLNHILEALLERSKLPPNAACIKTLVTTELFQAICDGYDCRCVNVPVGFKYVAQKICEWEKDPQGYTFIFGVEDSLGYLFGSMTRDKDAITISALLCEIALKAKLKGKTLVDIIHALYAKYGEYFDEVISVAFEDSKIGKEQMLHSMSMLRESPPRAIGGADLVESNNKSKMIIWKLSDGTRIVIRPSGTEAKIKIYCSTSAAASKSRTLELLSEIRAMM